MVQLTILWYDNFGKKQIPLLRNGTAAIPKTKDFPILKEKFFCTENVIFTHCAKVCALIFRKVQNTILKEEKNRLSSAAEVNKWFCLKKYLTKIVLNSLLCAIVFFCQLYYFVIHGNCEINSTNDSKFYCIICSDFINSVCDHFHLCQFMQNK